jgi:hypothetical protein
MKDSDLLDHQGVSIGSHKGPFEGLDKPVTSAIQKMGSLKEKIIY